MAAHERAVSRERDVTLNDTGSHACAGLVGFLRVLWELQRCATVCDREVRALDRFVLAGLQFTLQRAVIHTLHEVVGPRSDLDIVRAPLVSIPAITSLVSACAYGGDGG